MDQNRPAEPHFLSSFSHYVRSSWHELDPLPRLIMFGFLGLGVLFFLYMSYRLLFTLIKY